MGYSPPINALYNKNRVMLCAICKPRDLPFKVFTTLITELNNYLPLFPLSRDTNNMAPEDLNKILLHAVPTSWVIHSYL